MSQTSAYLPTLERGLLAPTSICGLGVQSPLELGGRLCLLLGLPLREEGTELVDQRHHALAARTAPGEVEDGVEVLGPHLEPAVCDQRTQGGELVERVHVRILERLVEIAVGRSGIASGEARRVLDVELKGRIALGPRHHALEGGPWLLRRVGPGGGGRVLFGGRWLRWRKLEGRLV